MDKKKICVIGTGGFAKEVMVIIYDLGRMDEVACFMEPDSEWEERTIMGIPVWPQSKFDPAKHTATIAIASTKIREKVTQQLPPETVYEKLISPKAFWTPWIEVGEGAIIGAGCLATVDIKIGKHVHLNCFTTLGHDTVIEDFVTTTSNVTINGNCHIGSHTYWGTRSSIRQGLTVCPEVVIGMSAVVVKDITEPGVYVGLPAKKLK
ncbi:MAG: NeuD/PglB/VioB family sugar acetyltransferase [Saprospiraceae bacterium]|nr:NeuD/PglB/VioB family sugar acetyltransferase [Saprospiraceae bacterium]